MREWSGGEMGEWRRRVEGVEEDEGVDEENEEELEGKEGGAEGVEEVRREGGSWLAG